MERLEKWLDLARNLKSDFFIPEMVCYSGFPGAGKGTQANLMANQLRIPHQVISKYLLPAVAQNKEIMHSVNIDGKMIDDQIALDIIIRVLMATPKGIYDGFPRSLGQAELLHELIKMDLIKFRGMIVYEADKDVIWQRIEKRVMDDIRQGRKPRSDDNQDTFTKRVAEYQNITEPGLNWFEAQGYKVYRIDGMQPIEEVAAKTKEVSRKIFVTT